MRPKASASVSGDSAFVVPRDLEHLPTAQLISFLASSSYRRSEYNEVARILDSREQSASAELARLESAKIAAESRCWTLDTEASYLRARCAELEDKLNKAQDEADKWRRRYSDVEAQSLHLIDEKLALQAKLDAKGEVPMGKLNMKRPAEVIDGLTESSGQNGSAGSAIASGKRRCEGVKDGEKGTPSPCCQ